MLQQKHGRLQSKCLLQLHTSPVMTITTHCSCQTTAIYIMILTPTSSLDTLEQSLNRLENPSCKTAIFSPTFKLPLHSVVMFQLHLPIDGLFLADFLRLNKI